MCWDSTIIADWSLILFIVIDNINRIYYKSRSLITEFFEGKQNVLAVE